MSMRRTFFRGGLLALFAISMIGIWMIPVVLAGFPHWLSGTLLKIKMLSETGVLINSSMRLTIVMFSWVYPYVGLQNIVLWSGLNATVMAAALLPLWWVVRTVRSAAVAWITIIIFAFMPMYWLKAVRVDGYAFGLLFLFLSFAAFLRFQNTNRTIAIVLSGLLFGLALACKSAFITFLPFFVLAYFWQNRSTVLRTLMEAGIFCIVAYSALALPLMAERGLSATERMMVFVPSSSESTPGEGHLYPDKYTYEHLREEYDAYIEDRVAHAGFLEKQEDQHFRLIFGVGEHNIFEFILNGFWLLLNILPPLLLQETIGGAFLWVFILFGIGTLYREERTLLFLMVGLWLTMEFILRFVLHFGRDHLMDIGWVLALFAAQGVLPIACAIRKHIPRLSSSAACVLVVCIIVMQQTQSARKYFAHLYQKSTVPNTYAAQISMEDLPADVVIAHPRREDLFFFSDHKNVALHFPTIQFLYERGRLHEPFIFYGVTDIIGYSDEDVQMIQSAVPGIHVIEPEKGVMSIPLPRSVRTLLHIIR